MLTYIWIGLGGAIGSMARYWIAGFMARPGEWLPWGTIAVNVSGSFLIGLFAAGTVAEGRWPLSPNSRLFLMAGLCGGYTTFSAFSLQTLNLLQSGALGRASMNVLLSVLACMAATWCGYVVAAGIRS